MTKEEPLLRRQSAPAEPVGEMSKYLLSLLDGKSKGKKKRPGNCPPRTAAAGGARAAPPSAPTATVAGARPPLAVPSTSSTSALSRPKVSALSVQTLDSLPGASRQLKPTEVVKKSAAGRTAPSSQHLSFRPSSKDSWPSLPEKRPVSRKITEVREAILGCNLNGEVAVVATTTKPTNPGAARVSLEDSAPSRSLSLLNRPVKRPRYVHQLGDQNSLLRENKTFGRASDDDAITSLFAGKKSSDEGAAEDSSTIALDNVDGIQTLYEERPLPQAPNKRIRPPGDSALVSSDINAVLAGNAWQQPSNLAAVRQDIPRPEKPSQIDSSAKSSTQGNYIRLNLRNKAGACRGARSKKHPQFDRRTHRPAGEQAAMRPQSSIGFRTSSTVCPISGVDPVDDFMDGMYSVKNDNKENGCKTGKTKSRSLQSAIPNCSGHQYPCKLLTVKKNTENKGRKFYCCSFPREEQCNHFEWADDTVEAAQMAIMQNKSVSGFIARHVASYMDQIKQHTVPELKHILKCHGLSTKGCKKQMLTRLAIWVRDEIAQATVEDDDGADEDDVETKDKATTVDAISLSSSDASDEDEGSEDPSDDDLEVASRSQTAEKGTVCNDETCTSVLQDEATDADEPHDPKYSTKRLLSLLKKLFGHSAFRDGQEWAIRRCLANEKTLLVAPTGFGKSLCYTMTAALKDGVCIVVSPLLSLIQDQLRLLPPGIAAVTLSGSMTRSKIAATLDDIARGRIKIVFVSPERLTSSSFRRLFRPRWNSTNKVNERIFPPVSLVCIDEAHCLSQWAHHFRPSYLRLRSAMTLIQPQSVLAITATAGPKVVNDICQILDIQFDVSGAADAGGNHGGVHIMQPERDNIDVSCYLHSSQEERLSKLIDILSPKRHAKSGSDRSSGLLSSGSVIVYVWRQRDAEAVAENIQAATDVVGGVTVYHGGMDSIARRQAQSKFMRGKIRICVATVAFGLGINKNDVAGVVHMYLSASPEHFLQETGRAGRDGRPAHAIALILEEEVLLRHSLAHSDLISRSQVEAFLRFVANIVQESANALPEDQTRTTSMHAGLMISKCMAACDCKAETVETLTSLLEQNGLLQVEGWFYDQARISPRRKSLARLANAEPVARAIIKCVTSSETSSGQRHEPSLDNGDSDSYNFSVIQCANFLGPNAAPRHVLAALRRMKLSGDIEYTLDLSDGQRGLHLHMLNAGLEIFRSQGTAAITELAGELSERLNSTIDASGNKALALNHILRQVAKESPDKCVENKSTRLHVFQKLIREYFKADGQDELVSNEIDLPPFTTLDQQQLLADVRCVFNYLSDLQGSRENENYLRFGECPDYTSLLISKFLAGLHGSSRFPLSMAFHHTHFGRLQSSHFETLHTAVKNVISS